MINVVTWLDEMKLFVIDKQIMLNETMFLKHCQLKKLH